MLYFDLIPQELVEILFMYLKDINNFVMLSVNYRNIYNKFLNNINNGIYNPNLVFNKHNINKFNKKLMYTFLSDLIDNNNNNKLNEYDTKTVILINDIHIDSINKEGIINTTNDDINNIKYLYIDKSYEEENIYYYNVILGKLYNNTYLYILITRSLIYGDIIYYKTSTNWNYLWNKILTNDTRQSILQYNNYPNNFKYQLK